VDRNRPGTEREENAREVSQRRAQGALVLQSALRRVTLRDNVAPMLEQIADDIWTAPAPLRFVGLHLNTRMTVCRLPDEGLVLIAPVQVTEHLMGSIDALGPVQAIVAPNLMHHLYVGAWMEAYPDAQSFGAPGLASKRPDLTFTHELGPAFDDAFDGELLRFPIEGMPKLNESLFLHRQSATLIATDFCFFMPEATGLTGLFASVMGIKDATRCEPIFRALIKDKAAFRAALHPLRTMEVRHLSMCHHSVLSVGASEALRGVLDQLKVPSSVGGDD
jgi:hypothetical protein